MGSWVHLLMGSSVDGFMGSFAYGFIGSWVHWLIGSLAYGFMGSWVHWFMGSWVCARTLWHNCNTSVLCSTAFHYITFKSIRATKLNDHPLLRTLSDQGGPSKRTHKTEYVPPPLRTVSDERRATKLNEFMGALAYRFIGSLGSRVHWLMGSLVHGFMGTLAYGFIGSWVHWLMGSLVHGFIGLWVH